MFKQAKEERKNFRSAAFTVLSISFTSPGNSDMVLCPIHQLTSLEVVRDCVSEVQKSFNG